MHSMKKTILTIFSSLFIFAQAQAYENPFKVGDVLKWSTAAMQNGSMKVMSVSGDKFKIEQFNVKNKRAGGVIFEGEIIGEGKYKLTAARVNEVWVGDFKNGSIVGKVNGSCSFKINGVRNVAVKRDYPFRKDRYFRWETSASQYGTLKILEVSSDKFKLEQFNEVNKSEGGVVLEGKFGDDGKCYIFNKRWNETWIGEFKGDALIGKINNVYTFKISADDSAAPKAAKKAPSSSAQKPKVDTPAKAALPFSKGTLFTWKTSVGDSGIMKVASVDGKTFVLEQTNKNNMRAGIVIMEGELRADGTYCIINKSYRETWIGKASGEGIVGKVNKYFKFEISPVGKVETPKDYTEKVKKAKARSWWNTPSKTKSLR